jgi:hypothetical protein
VEVPYCSSDLWAGAQDASQANPWFFHGRAIVREVIQTLHIAQDDVVLLAGSSAGGVGVLVNLDDVQAAVPQANVMGAADSGWFFPIAPLTAPNCSIVYTCDIATGVQKLMEYANATGASACASQQPSGQQYQCFFGQVRRALR